MSSLKLSKIILITGFFIAVPFCYQIEARKKLTTNPKIMSECISYAELDILAGTKVEKLFEKLEKCDYERHYIDEPPGMLSGIVINMKGENTQLKIYFKRFKYVEAFDEARNWDWQLIKKERIKSIKVYNDGELVKEIK